MLKQPTSVSLEPLETIFDPSMSTFLRRKVLKTEDSQMLSSPTVNQAVVNLDEKRRDSGISRYSATDKLLFKYTEGDNGRVSSEKEGRSLTNGLFGLVRC